MSSIMEFVIALVTVLVTNAASSGILYYSLNRKLKNVEVESKRTGVKDQEVEILRKQDDEWQELYQEEKQEKQKLEEEMKELRLKYEDVTKTNGLLELERLKLIWCKCIVNGCPNRKPPRDYEKVGE